MGRWQYRQHAEYEISGLHPQGRWAKGSVISIAVGGKNQFQDNGARMIHIGKNTSSTIISKSICKNGGTANYRGTVRILPGAENAHAHVECDTLILDDKSRSDTLPKTRFATIRLYRARSDRQQDQRRAALLS
jgi:Fe-S cluster assembly scaffold protein SufB